MDPDQPLDALEQLRVLLLSPFTMMALAAGSAGLVTAVMMKLLQ